MNHFNSVLRAITRHLKAVAPDAMLVCGALAFAYGAWLVCPAAGFMTGGALLILGGYLTARGD